MKEISWDLYFINLAKEISTKSKDPSKKCGCVLVAEDNSIISVGFNGLPQCLTDREKYLNDRDTKIKIILHAEENALAFVSDPTRLVGGTVYTWPLPSCAKCASQCLQRKVKRFVSPPLDNKDSRWADSVELAKTIIEDSGKIWDIISIK